MSCFSFSEILTGERIVDNYPFNIHYLNLMLFFFPVHDGATYDYLLSYIHFSVLTTGPPPSGLF